MHSNSLITGTLAVVATTGLIGLGGAAHGGGASTTPTPSNPTSTTTTTTSTTTHERGIVIECTGTVRGRHVYASLYENNRYGNELQLLVGDDDHQVGGSRPDADGFLDGRRVRAAMKVGGHRAVVAGTARRVGDPIPMSEEQDDAGQHITATGHHRSLSTDLTLTWRRTTAPLECATAFVYHLRVTKESLVD